ncbi:uncharacterized protein [Palaemon carinicauda]|uniref:uncharacterized protein n=1 Tax=Palaemon carinicauda TaxID=392227 RepID=UPI0035B5C92E
MHVQSNKDHNNHDRVNLLGVTHGSTDFVSQGPWVKVRRFVVPQYVALGKNATLECDYLVQKHASLYSLKWYKINSQFYQYIPTNENPFSVFSLEGLHQDQVVASADGRRVVILGIQAAASDTYRWEMVAEGHPFHTTQRSGNMTVAVVPNERPLLTGSREYYHLKDLIKLNCTAPFAKPPISLTWYCQLLLGWLMPKSYQGKASEITAELNNVNEIERIVNPAELESVSSQLTLSVKRHHFKGSTMSIKCVGRLADLYQRSSQVIIREPSSQWFIISDLYHTLHGRPVVAQAASRIGYYNLYFFYSSSYTLGLYREAKLSQDLLTDILSF